MEIKRVNIVANIEPKSDKDEFLNMLTNFSLQELFTFIEKLYESDIETFDKVQPILNEELRKRLSCEFKEEV
jgi:hypothetical protein